MNSADENKRLSFIFKTFEPLIFRSFLTHPEIIVFQIYSSMVTLSNIIDRFQTCITRNISINFGFRSICSIHTPGLIEKLLSSDQNAFGNRINPYNFGAAQRRGVSLGNPLTVWRALARVSVGWREEHPVAKHSYCIGIQMPFPCLGIPQVLTNNPI